MMLDPRMNYTRGAQIVPMETSFDQDDKGFLISDPRPPEYVQSMHKKTVKELLMIRRQFEERLQYEEEVHRHNNKKRSCLQDDSNSEHKFKFAKSEAFSSDLSPYLAHILTSPPENGPFTPHQVQQPLALQGAPAAEVTLFHWQIQRETQRIGGLSPELLSMQDADGDTFLHIAVAQGRRALAYVLATKMAPCGFLDVKEHNGQTALQIAAASNQQLIVQDLLTHGAQVNTRDLWGRSPLHLCAEKGHFLSLQSIWRTLSGQMIDIEMFNFDGLTALHAAVLSHNAIVKELRSLGNNCSYVTKELQQRKQMYVECIKTLLLMGASCEMKDLKSGRTCLHMASEEANIELLNLFLNQPSSLSVVNVKTFSGNTALHIVSSLQNHGAQVEAAKLLMRKGADPGARNFENELACQLVPEGLTGDKVRQILKGKHVHA